MKGLKLPWETRVRLAQLRSGHCSRLDSYLSRQEPNIANVCPACSKSPAILYLYMTPKTDTSNLPTLSLVWARENSSFLGPPVSWPLWLKLTSLSLSGVRTTATTTTAWRVIVLWHRYPLFPRLKQLDHSIQLLRWSKINWASSSISILIPSELKYLVAFAFPVTILKSAMAKSNAALISSNAALVSSDVHRRRFLCRFFYQPKDSAKKRRLK